MTGGAIEPLVDRAARLRVSGDRHGSAPPQTTHIGREHVHFIIRHAANARHAPIRNSVANDAAKRGVVIGEGKIRPIECGTFVTGSVDPVATFAQTVKKRFTFGGLGKALRRGRGRYPTQGEDTKNEVKSLLSSHAPSPRTNLLRERRTRAVHKSELGAPESRRRRHTP